MIQTLHVLEQRLPVVELIRAVDAEAQVHLTTDKVDQLNLKIENNI